MDPNVVMEDEMDASDEKEEDASDGEEDMVDEDSSSEDDEEQEREKHYNLERKVVELRKELSKSPYAYNTHVELISSLKELGELDQLRHARESMHSVYPLSEELWLEWLRDEMKLASTDEDREKIELLFKRATKDYLSIDIWVEYIQYSLAGMVGGPEGLKKIRAVMDEAVRHGGLHVVKGALLWDSYRDFEMAMYQSTKGEDNVAQAQHITQLFQRQLSVPLLDMDRTWTEYNEWLQLLNKSEPEPHVKASYEKAKANLEKIAPLEETLLIAVENADKVAVYRTYLDLETDDIKDPVRIQALYERIVAEMPLDATFWIDYCHFVDRQFKSAETAMTVFNRAIRNCSWSGTLWSDYIFAAQRYQKEHGFISSLVEKAFGAGLAAATDYRDVWMAFLEYLVRKCKWEDEEQVQQLREAFTRATEHLVQTFEAEGDPECLLLQYWAYLEVKKLSNVAKSRELWGKIISLGHSKSAQWWLAYIQFERAYGNDLNLVRKLFTKSLNAVASTDWPESIVQQWLQFEREEGDLETMETARLKCEMRMKKVNEERAKQSATTESPATEKPAKGRKRAANEAATTAKPSAKTAPTAAPPNKKAKTTAGDRAAPPPSKPAGSQDGSVMDEEVTRALRTVPQPPADPSRHARTVFISNLDYGFTEDDIRDAMSSSGAITEIRLIRDYKQRSKGYCYVEFSKESEAKAALKRDREPLKNRPMFISPSETDAALKHPVFKFQTTLEKKKLFVKGLPTKATKEDVEKLFSQYGALKDVRLVTYRSGISKGLAYVDFEDEVSATTALMKTDGSTFQDHVLTVALSNPPPRKDKHSLLSDDSASLGSGSKTRRTQVAFVPNAVLRQNQQQQSSSSSSMPPPPAPKNNADFRSMIGLLKK